jgi:NAD(P)-dependent dehydrogenase (short-subunit alcohol dehydrogenase family)
MSGQLDGRVAIVTGAAQGIGRVFAQALAGVGAIPIVADRNVPKAEAVAQEIGGAALPVEVDVADPASVQAMADKVLTAHGRIDILVNNAAIFSTITMRPFEQIPLDEWDQVLRVNLTGPFLCARAVLPAMRRAQWGRIVNIGSGAVTLGRPGYLHYIATKSGLAGMSRSMARELGPDGITVNTILPGATFTEIERKTITPEWVERIVAQQCVHRPQVPQDLVAALLFLCSPGAAFVTGQAINVDGGATHL